MKKKGILFIVSSPSGVGKTTIANFLVKHDANIVRSISFTTRNLRGNEKSSHDYFFITEGEFFKLCKDGKMLEHAKVFQYYYGTSKEFIESTLKSGKDVLCCIDWQGAIQIKEKLDAVSIFLLPPSMNELERRLKTRGTDEPSMINHRLEVAKEEMSKYKMYDYIVVNDKLDVAQNSALNIINAERNKLSNNEKYFEDLLAKI